MIISLEFSFKEHPLIPIIFFYDINKTEDWLSKKIGEKNKQKPTFVKFCSL